MIRINLAPADELENPYWFVPDVAVFVVFGLASFLIVRSYLDSIREEIDLVREQTASYQENTAKLKPELARFDTLEKEIADLNNRIAALNRITVSKIERYKPVIVLEHLQSLRPEGLWYLEIKFDTGANSLEIRGGAFDNLIVAEFLSGLLSTKGQNVDPLDLRTQVYFDNLDLDFSNIGGNPSYVAFYQQFPSFTLRVQYHEKQENKDAPANADRRMGDGRMAGDLRRPDL